MELNDKLLKQITHIKKGKNDVAKFVTLSFKNGGLIIVTKGFRDNFYNVYFCGKDNDENKKFNSLNEALTHVYLLIYNYCYKECDHTWNNKMKRRNYECKKCGETRSRL